MPINDDTYMRSFKYLRKAAKRRRKARQRTMKRVCHRLLNRLRRLLNVIWMKRDIPADWKEAEGIFTPKEKNSKNID
ncbi:hypothetical protein DPMN_184378 [Dreissena polymorpha]|uniref:Uncharacterized protein n=1 Tax=Dreissena polymorpha TaxID=45954 RepID=A0A9D4DJ19_DREPO|nr:hypothetical protein DPMN_184378 [Dreissena polymorpha]